MLDWKCSSRVFSFLYRCADESLARPGRKQARKHVRDARDFNNIEARAVIRFFFFLQGKAPKEIHAILTKTLACFLPGRTKDLSSPLYLSFMIIKPLEIFLVSSQMRIWSRDRKRSVLLRQRRSELITMKYACAAFVEWYWRGEKKLTYYEKTLFHRRFSTIISTNARACDRTRASHLKGLPLNSWAMARPEFLKIYLTTARFDRCEFVQERTDPASLAGPCESGNEPSSSIKRGEFHV